jgi:hypothetical protein
MFLQRTKEKARIKIKRMAEGEIEILIKMVKAVEAVLDILKDPQIGKIESDIIEKMANPGVLIALNLRFGQKRTLC